MTAPASTIPRLRFDSVDGSPRIDVDKLIASRLLVQANSGGGKSRALRYLLEQTQGRAQHLVIDPEGEFASLREKFPYLLAGKDGDVPATPKTAKLLCRRLLETRASAVLDLYDLQLDERRAFVRVFLDELMHLPRALWHPLIVVLDEAHVFAPEKGHGDSQSLNAVIALATQGRKRGYCLVAATQRLSKFHKDTAAELLNKMIGRTGLDVDVKRAADELGLDRDSRLLLRTLQPGTFYAYGPAVFDAHGDNVVVEVRTGKVQTTHPEAGKLAAPPPPAPAAVAKIVEQLRDIPKDTDEELRTVADYQRKNADLQRELKRAQSGLAERIVEKPVVDHDAIERALAKLRAEHEQRMAILSRAVDAIVTGWTTAARSLQPTIDAAVKATVDASESMARASSRAPKWSPDFVTPRASSSALARLSKYRVPDKSNGSLPAGERAILTAIAQFDAPTREQISITTGYKTSTRNAYIQRLVSAGYVVVGDDVGIQATREGIEALGSSFTPLPTGRQLREYWLEKLPDGERAILDGLCEIYPDARSRDWLSDRTGYKPSTRNAYIQRLSTRKLVSVTADGIRASAHLFD
jgi:hypothetical protein